MAAAGLHARSTVTSLWNQRDLPAAFSSGVSLHSHTSQSLETLTFLHKLLAAIPGLPHMFAHYERQATQRHVQLDFQRGNWRPPLVPRMAHAVETGQIAQLGLSALVALTDHDTIAAPQLLRSVPSARGIPVSLEWTVPFGRTEIHLGVHNLPSATAFAWTSRLEAYTAHPLEADLRAILFDLHALPGVLVIFNHPLWDLHRIGPDLHRREMLRFLELAGPAIHAIELNGLRHARENRGVIDLARDTGHLLISGGDRHGMEPSACINLSHASSFGEFVDEIRRERQSHVLFLDQYRRPWEQRILQSTLDAVSDFPEFTKGWRRWDDRVFHPDRDGVLRPASELWPDGIAPLPLRLAIQCVRLGRNRTLLHAFGATFPSNGTAIGEVELL